MNIFLLDNDPIKCAQYHNDRHLVKMITEQAQLLSTAHRVLDNIPNESGSFYRKTHVNHPSAVWVRESVENYNFTYDLFVSLCIEYTRRYGKIHLCETKMTDVLAVAPRNIPKRPRTKFKLAIADESCHDDDPVKAYRNYYIKHKRHIASWKAPATVPEWFC